LSDTEFVEAPPQAGAPTANASPERRRLTLALLFSLLIHTVLLSLIFGGAGWLPGFAFPWQDRRIAVPDLRVALVPAQVTAAEPAGASAAEDLQQESVEQPVTSGRRRPHPRPVRRPRDMLQQRSCRRLI